MLYAVNLVFELFLLVDLRWQNYDATTRVMTSIRVNTLNDKFTVLNCKIKNIKTFQHRNWLAIHES